MYSLWCVLYVRSLRENELYNDNCYINYNRVDIENSYLEKYKKLFILLRNNFCGFKFIYIS